MKTNSLSLLALIFVSSAFGQVKTFEGKESALMGTSMTIEETKRVAFEAARREALQSAGSFVKSKQTLSNGELSETVQIVSSSVVRLLEKETRKVRTEETFRFVVRARFEVDLENMKNRPKNRTGFDKSIRIQTSGLKKPKKIPKTSAKIEKNNRSRQKRKFEQHLRYVRENLHPQSFLSFEVAKKPFVKGEEVVAEYNIHHSELSQSKAILDSLQKLQKGWEPLQVKKPFKTYYVLAAVGRGVGGRMVFVKPVGGLPLNYTKDFAVGTIHTNLTRYRANSLVHSKKVEVPNLPDLRSLEFIITRFHSLTAFKSHLKSSGFFKKEMVWQPSSRENVDLKLDSKHFQKDFRL